MKNYFFFFLLSLCGIVSTQYVDRSSFRAGFHTATTVGDASDFTNLGVGLDVYQHWGFPER